MSEEGHQKLARWVEESPLLLRTEEAANLLRIGKSTLYELIRVDNLPTVRFGRSVRVPRKALERWLDFKVEKALEEQENTHAK
jgi:excisionase family DNA binding protein|tara:strand:+ start:301 stop:549 length:249 start_codon:yes stop_codon:yes gene_type:complete